jgi:hypothetical protein
MIMLKILVSAQYSASPLGKVKAKNPNMSGIIQSIMRPIDCWFGSAVGDADIFCSTHMLAATMMAMKTSPLPRSSHRKLSFSGTCS